MAAPSTSNHKPFGKTGSGTGWIDTVAGGSVDLAVAQLGRYRCAARRIRVFMLRAAHADATTLSAVTRVSVCGAVSSAIWRTSSPGQRFAKLVGPLPDSPHLTGVGPIAVS